MNLAHLHLMLNHIPVLGGVGTIALLTLAAFKENDALTKLTLQFMVLIGILALPVYFTGEPAEEIIEHLPGVTEAFISNHEKFALFSLISTELLAVIGLVGLYSFRKNPKTIMEYWRSIGVVAIVNASLMFATANYGGEIRHTEIRKSGSADQSIEKDKPAEQESEDH